MKMPDPSYVFGEAVGPYRRVEAATSLAEVENRHLVDEALLIDNPWTDRSHDSHRPSETGS